MTRRQLTDAQWKFIGSYLPIGRFGPYPERLREQFEGMIWRLRSSAPVEGDALRVRPVGHRLRTFSGLAGRRCLLRGLADTEDRTRDLLSEVLAHQADHQHRRLVQPDRRGLSARPHDLAAQLRAPPVQQNPLPAVKPRASMSTIFEQSKGVRMAGTV